MDGYIWVLGPLDFIISIAMAVFMIYLSIRLCIREPWCPLFALAIFLASLILAAFFVNFNKLLSRVRLFFKYGLGELLVNAMIPDGDAPKVEPSSLAHLADLGSKLRVESSSREFVHQEMGQGYMPSRYSSHSGLVSITPSESELRHGGSHDDDHKRRGRYSSTANSFMGRINEWVLINRYRYQSMYRIDLETGRMRLLSTFNHWLKTHWIKALLHNPIVEVMSIILTICWCIMWEWAAPFMSRKEGNYSLLDWNVEEIPELYWGLEASYQLIFAISYLLHLYSSEWGTGYIFSFHGLVDICMTPVSAQAIMFTIALWAKDGSFNRMDLEKFGLLLVSLMLIKNC
ncbi:hypothetical protein BdWA1_001006 [Babesia duncani]|uniref:Uncharacterized protein n=1 Tax=Babesia duncani TaxID=323732 RepID=A0AAD9PNB6_9APIC|nr:hypothetical protein BdWA1_001006 [Babesia duncani]